MATRPSRSAAAAPEPALTIRSLVLVHGAGSGPWVYSGWLESFPGIEVAAVDLHAGLRVGRAAMSNYAAVLYRTASLLPPPLALCGWSMGGLTAMLAAEPAGAARLVLLEPSPPAEVQGTDRSVELLEGTFDPEAAYGPFPAGVRARPESSLARAERRRGVSVPELPCPTLVVSGDEFAEERGRRIAALYGAQERYLAGCDHWGLVREAAPRELVRGFLAA